MENDVIIVTNWQELNQTEIIKGHLPLTIVIKFRVRHL